MNRFEIFNTPHLIVLLLTVLISVLFVVIPKKFKYPPVKNTISLLLFISIVFSTLFAIIDKYINGYLYAPLNMPMQLCDWVMLFVLVTFITKSQYAYEITYFWGLGGTLQALITPDLAFNYPSWIFVIFFINHSTIIISIIYFTFVFGLRPYLVSIKRVFLWSQVFFFFAFITNVIFDTNYGFLMEKPIKASLFDYLGPWPLYLLSLEIVGLLSFFIYYLPFLIKDKYFNKKTANI